LHLSKTALQRHCHPGAQCDTLPFVRFIVKQKIPSIIEKLREYGVEQAFMPAAEVGKSLVLALQRSS
ncbi:MAG: hypothetical protein ACXVJ0_15350, partial [Candidatus Angelobacter sp.]